MRDLPERPRHRVQGRQAITRSLGGLLIRAHRYSRCRATLPADQHWAARLIDMLEQAYATARDDKGTPT